EGVAAGSSCGPARDHARGPVALGPQPRKARRSFRSRQDHGAQRAVDRIRLHRQLSRNPGWCRQGRRRCQVKRRTLVLGSLSAASAPAAAQEPFPSKPIQMIVPFPPGGVADITGRPVAHVMGRLLKQSVVVVHKPGAGGSVGAAQAGRAARDGYTILMALSSISVLPVADRLQGRPPAYELDQFAPIALISADPTVLVVRADGPYQTLKDLVDAAKAKPGTINYGSSGV